MSAKTGKRPLRSLSAHEKLEAIRRVHDGESKASVARDIGVPESTLRGWCKNENKISYLSRQSSPETDESEPKDKRSKLEDPTMIQPFNLSLKNPSTTFTHTPNSESLYTPVDYSKHDMDTTPKTPQNLSIKTDTPKCTASQMTERERNRAELARLSIELGLNRPEMFTSNASGSTPGNLADLAANINLLSQWNNIVMQQQLLQNGQQSKKVAATPDTTTLVSSSGASTSSKHQSAKLPKEQQPVEDYIKCWLRTQEALLSNQSRTNLASSNGISSSATPTTTATTSTTLNSASALNGAYQSSWFWKWYKQLSYSQQSTTEKPILYQQLTKDTNDSENFSLEKACPNKANNNNYSNNNKSRSVLDNLLLINNNNVAVDKKDRSEDVLSPVEALEHGEKFMRWLESCSDPSVTAVQIMQFRALLTSVRNGADRRNNGDLSHNKTKVKRKWSEFFLSSSEEKRLFS